MQKYVQVFSFHTTDSSCVVINVTAVPGEMVLRHSEDVNLPCLSFEQLSQGIQELNFVPMKI